MNLAGTEAHVDDYARGSFDVGDNIVIHAVRRPATSIVVIVSSGTVNDLLVGSANDCVVAVAVVNEFRQHASRTRDDRVVPGIAIEGIPSGSAINRVVAGETVNRISAVEASNRVVTGGAVKRIVARSTVNRRHKIPPALRKLICTEQTFG